MDKLLKPIKPKRYITGGTGLDFARRILERGAARRLYEPSYGDLIFAVGAAGERGDIMSVLELLENVLDALKNGLGTRGGQLSLYVRGTLSLVRNILSVGGNSPEYRTAAAIYNELCERLSDGVFSEKASENRVEATDALETLREKLRENILLIKNAEKTRSSALSVREYTAAGRVLPAARALGASGFWLLRMAERDPELMKTVKSNRSFLELALRCEELRRRGSELRRGFSVLIANLNERQSDFIGRFIRERGLFSSILKERDGSGADGVLNVPADSASDLKYLAERSSERELNRFFREFYRELGRESRDSNSVRSFYGNAGTVSSVFSSEKDMREFFEAADLKSVERLCEQLSERSQGEVNVLREAEREYERLSEMSEELVKRAFSVLERQVSKEELSWEQIREKIRSSELFREYVMPDVQNVSNELYSADSELVLSFAEFAVNKVRELREVQGGAVPSGISLDTAEKLERILYYGQSEISVKCAEIRRLISTAADHEIKELSRLYAEFTGVGSTERILREMRSAAESVKPENRLEAIRVLLSSAASENAEARTLLTEIADFTAKNGSGSFREILERSGGYSKLEALFTAENGSEYERFSERVGKLFSEYDGRTLTKTLERLRSFSDSRGLLREFESALSETENSSRTEIFSENLSEFEQTAGGLLSVLELCENHSGELPETLVKIAESLEKTRRFESADIRRQTASELAKTLSERSLSEKTEGRYSSELKAISDELSEISSEEQFSSERFSALENKFYELAEKVRLEYSDTPNAGNNLAQSEIKSLRRELYELRNSVLNGTESASVASNASVTSNDVSDIGRFLERISRLSDSVSNTEGVSEMQRLYISRLSELAKTLSERRFSEKSEGRYFSQLKEISEELSEISSEEQFSSERFSALENKLYELAEKTELEYSEAPNARDNAVQSEIRSLRRELYELRNSVLNGTESASVASNASVTSNDVSDIGRFLERISRLSDSVSNTEGVSEMQRLYISRLSELAKTLSKRRFSEKSDTGVRERFTRELFGAFSDSTAVQSIGETLNVLRLAYPYTGSERDLTFLTNFGEYSPADREFSGRLVYGVSELSELSKFSSYSALSNFSNSLNFSNLSREILRERDIEKILPKMSFIALRRNSVERQTTRAERELLIHLTKSANSPTERIFRQTSEQTERTDYSAAELFYTEEYFDSSGSAITVNYAVQPKGFSDNSDEVVGRLSGLKSKLDDVSRQLESVKTSEEEMTKRFMLKSERAVLEKEIKSSIEQDITLAGKRHGIY